ncbi:MAG: rod shape-determining protein RodA [Candidatus Omnitrophica bacterium]|nr:rod shape-determining protein RodA [Candidatus Omnitrophota bacterium]
MIAQRDISKIIWIHTIFIMALGLAALYSASYNNTRVGQEVFYDQFFFALFGLFVMFVLSFIDYRKFFDFAYFIYGFSVLFLVLVFFLGHHALGATRWFSILGFRFQPSELSKLAVILFLGRYLSQQHPKLAFDFGSSLMGLWDDLLLPLGGVGISALLIFKQPDLGTAILVFGIFIIMVYASGVSHRIFLIFMGILLALMPLGWHFLKPYQRDRLTVFLNPNHDPTGAGYTITQSKIAVGSGQLLGKGWLAGTQNQLNFLTERHTDFIFSVIGEEWGLLGSLFLLYCYVAIIYCGFMIAYHNKDRFGQLVTIGIISILAMQVIINIGMNIGLCPVVGVPLPLISYGRTSFLIFAIMLGFLLNLGRRRTVF